MPRPGIPVHGLLQPSQHPVKMVELRQSQWKARFRRLAYWTDDPPPGQDDATVLAAFNRV
jgi:hypothetical protein